ncbi:MAG: nucleoside hydrolase [Clostridia bacterium]|nr:nucleoside hydrolase [Clostridia bacterium]
MFNITKSLKDNTIKKAILDTDTYNEIDDQFALALSLCAKERINLLAVCAAPFSNAKSDNNYAVGMEQSYEEIGRVMGLVCESNANNTPVPYYRGSTERMPDENTPVSSEAADMIYRLAMEHGSANDRVYVIAIGALTNVSSAITAHPEICDRIAVIWLGANARWEGGWEFNLQGDLNAVNALYASEVPLLTVPCSGVASNMVLRLGELKAELQGKSPLGDYLYEIMEKCAPGEDKDKYDRIIWDVSAIGVLLSTDNYTYTEQPRFRTDKNYRYEFGAYEGTFEHIEKLDCDKIFKMMFAYLK